MAALRLKALRDRDVWRAQAREAQLPPDGAWRTWFVQAGRGFGKTRLAAEWIREQIMFHGARRVALVGATSADVRDVMIEGESGLIACCERYGVYPIFKESRRVVLFPNGAKCFTYSAEEPDRLRGPQHDHAWGDEIASWPYEDAYDNLDMGLRLGSDPRMVVTSTPKYIPLIRRLVEQSRIEQSDVIIHRGTMSDNMSNLPATFLRTMERRYAGTRIGRQELSGELLEDVEGALWTLNLIDMNRVEEVPTEVSLVRCVVGVDPSASSKSTSAEAGIVVAALGSDGVAYVLDDLSLQGTPSQWGNATVYAYDHWRADHVTPETNNGGEMVTLTLRTIRHDLPVNPVTASRGKATRAEPISTLYEQGRVKHVGTFAKLEDQMSTWVPGAPSPDRMDALVWALTDLMLGADVGEFEMLDEDTLTILSRFGI